MSSIPFSLAEAGHAIPPTVVINPVLEFPRADEVSFIFTAVSLLLRLYE